MGTREKKDQIRSLVLDNLRHQPKDIAGVVASTYGITRQAANRYLKEMCEEGILSATGKTRSRQYTLNEEIIVDEVLTVAGLQEDIPWSEKIGPQLTQIPRNVFQILNYGFTEILNNAIDHSGSPQVAIRASRTVRSVDLRIVDFGVGIFKKIKDSFQLEDEFQAICQLATGKLTTDPARHSGEGIFFTSRMFDHFAILSGSLYFAHSPPEPDHADNDWLIEDRTGQQQNHAGTYVEMAMNLSSTTKFDSVFNLFASEDNDYAFSKTHVPVKLMQYGPDNLVSRSQAKRLLSRFHVFEEVILDFAGIEFLGQAFADEIFRVYYLEHPNVRLIPINTVPSVQGMINHAISNRNSGTSRSPSN